MIDFIEYVVSELKSKRLSKGHALELIKQFSFHSSPNEKSSVIHPLLHLNTSDLTQQNYSSIFSGQEFFLADHQIKMDGHPNKRILPGVAYLEMIRAALQNSLPAISDDNVLELHNTIWAYPIVVDEAKEVSIALLPDDNDDGKIDYEIYSYENDLEVIHCQGQAVIKSKPAPAKLDLAQLKSQMSAGTLMPDSVYTAFSSLGLNYGPAHQGIKAIYQGNKQLLAHLLLPKSVATEQSDFFLHPSMMDSALQASIGLTDNAAGSAKPSLPFALDLLQIIATCTDEMFAWVRYSPGSKSGDNVVKLDIDLCDQDGNICVQMRRFTSRILEAGVGESRTKPATETINPSAIPSTKAATLIAYPEWEICPVSPTENLVDYAQHHIILGEINGIQAKQVEVLIPDSQCTLFDTKKSNIAESYGDIAIACFEKIQTIFKSKPQGKVLIQIAISNLPEQSFLMGLTGLLKTAALENPQLIGQIIVTRSNTTADDLAAQLQESRQDSNDSLIKYDDGKRYVQTWREGISDQEHYNLAFKDYGVYIIIGGLGGLGFIFAQEILKQTTKARIIFTGRSELTAEKKELLAKLSTVPDQISYRQVDLSNSEQLEQVISAIKEEYQQINGILHCAGMIIDNFILKKTATEFSQVLEPKVTGTVNLDKACKNVDLDFLILFSSGVSALGNIGQADYAAANGFMDHFASYRNELVAAKQRHGKTLSINWPLWQDGGMSMDAASQALMQQHTGMLPMQTATGIWVFYYALESHLSQIMAMEGDVAQMRSALFSKQEFPRQTNAHASAQLQTQTKPFPLEVAVTTVKPDQLQEKTQEHLRKQFSEVLKLPAHQIDVKAALENYGINSILAMNLTSQMEKTFGSLSKTLLFEYQSISELSEYFVESHSATLAALFSTEELSTTEVGSASVVAPVSSPVKLNNTNSVTPVHTHNALTSSKRHRRQSFISAVGQPHVSNSEPVAIVGLSGRYPEASNIEEYWLNLREGKDCITEVPKERWDWQAYFTEDREQSGHYSKWGGFIEGVDEFDPKFFNISPREAEYIDPQERLFLQHAWMAMEDAGYTRARLQIPRAQGLAGQVGVYVGVMYGEYNSSGSLASIANRTSYVLNLHGPSMTLDTMCSSSLTAIHLACQDLKNGRTDLAIAGGVNVSIHPNKYSMLSAGQFISSDGHCQSFGEGGDGYIPGEGVGAVILKRLSEALQDGNHIYGLIKGSALNHGGKTNGYTVPNPQAQAGVITQALMESNTDPRHVSYIEAHGTGTKLGDPIEIAALTKAFNQHIKGMSVQQPEPGFCAIGSAKSNIGHCESAAGIAGLTKVLLQMRHQQIVPSLHSTRLNPHIDFEKSPFVVNQHLRTWHQPVVDGETLARVAGISSFGAGGSNAHIIVEEFRAPLDIKQPAINEKENHDLTAIVPLSAKNTEQLQQKARDLLAFIQKSEQSIDLMAMAYTLQLGREAMDERLGFKVSSVEQLAEKLQAFINGVQQVEDIYQGQVKSNKDTLSLFSSDPDWQQTINKWIADKKLSKLVELWAKGLEFDWNDLYGDVKPKFISLPTYPFAKEKYWIDPVESDLFGSKLTKNSKVDQKINSSVASAVLHPLVHTNTSSLFQYSYSSTFNGEEYFLNDYQMAGQKILPAMSYLEMARAAVEKALPSTHEASILELHNSYWGQPFVAGKNKTIRIDLFPSGLDKHFNHQIDYEIYSQGDAGEIIHCQGSAVLSKTPAPEKLNIAQISAQMGPSRHDAASMYDTLNKSGLHYGFAYQAIASLQQNHNQLLAELHLPNAFASQSGYVLNPGLMEGAVQAAVALTSELNFSSSPQSLSLPVALESARIIFACNEVTFAWVRYSPASGSEDHTAKVDVDLCDSQGNICVQLRGFHLRGIESRELHLQVFAADSYEQVGLTLATPSANPIQYSIVENKPKSISLIDPHKVIAIDVATTNAKPSQVHLTISQKIKAITSQTFGELNNLANPVSPVQRVPSSLTLSSSSIPDSAKTQLNSSMQETALSGAQLQQQLRVSLAEALYMQASDVDIDRPFVDLGLDSIVGVEWVKVINKQYALEISATRVYDYSNIKLLSEFIEQEIEKTHGKVISETVSVFSTPSVVDSGKSSTYDIITPADEVANIEDFKNNDVAISREQLQQELRASLAEALYMQIADIELDKSFVDLGLDSIVGVEWVKVINKQYGLEISATRVYDYSSVKLLASFLETEISKLPNRTTPISTPKPVVADVVKKSNTAPMNNAFYLPASTHYPTLTRKKRIANTSSESSTNPHAVASTQSAPAIQKVAIIGMSGRYPQADNLTEYWDNLVQGKNSITEIPASRWDVNQYYDPDASIPGKIYCKWLGMLNDADCFDPMFFQISPSEAEVMDPQHRLFMQESYRAFEDAGYSSNSLSNKKCGVYLGIMSSEYSSLLAKNNSTSVNTTGNSFAIGAARIAYYLNLKGPAIPVDTACSSSLVAIHLGCQALLNREIDMALAGGVSLYLIPESYLGMCQAGMLSPEGQCKTFDDAANGFVPGEGVGAVVLKRLQDAERDKDFIYGVILGSAINQDGKTNGITAPSVNSQIELERDCYAKYGINPDTISYIETHGTGTKLGDPIELEALSTVFKEKTSRKNYCALGAVKSNIGHISGAAGVAGVQKVLLSMQHKTLVPSLNVSKENSHFNFNNSPFYISKETQQWNTEPGTLRRAGVSAFGFSGTNAHLVIEEYSAQQNRAADVNSLTSNSGVIIPLSARTAEQLQQMAVDLLAFTRRNEQSLKIAEHANLKSMAYTLQTGREAMKERLAFLVTSINDLTEKLEAYIDGEKNIADVFQGQVARDKNTLSLFSLDPDLKETVNKWMASHRLSMLVDLWVKGLDLDWHKLYNNDQPQRISLPTYPFAKERYWVEQKMLAPVLGLVGTTNNVIDINNRLQQEKSEQKQKTYYHPQWKFSSLDSLDEKLNATEPLLILDTTDELFQAVNECREKASNEQKIVLVKLGSDYQEEANNVFRINAEREEDYLTLLEKLKAQGQLPQQIIHHCSDSTNLSTKADIENQLNCGFYAIFNLCKVLISLKHHQQTKVISLYSSHAKSNETKMTAAQHAALGGFLLTLSLENKFYRTKLIEVNGSIVASVADKARIVLKELCDKQWSSEEIRYQFEDTSNNYTRYVKGFSSYNPAQNVMTEMPLKQRGVYIITGGLGGLGLIFSEYLAKNFQAKLVIIGRSTLGAEQEQKLSRLRSLGAEVIYCEADVSKLEAMESVFLKAKDAFSEINGVIHSAGVNRDSFIIRKTRTEIEAVFDPKVYGTINLDQVTREENLDLFVLFSSGSGAMGNIGQADYAYANHFLDSFAESREALRTHNERFGKTISINWPLWIEGGMTASQDVIQTTEKETGMCALPTNDGIEYFEDFVRSNLSQGLALYGFPSEIAAYMNRSVLPVHENQLITNDKIDSEVLTQKTESYLKHLVSIETKLAPERIDSQEPFESFGFDSMMIGRFNASLQRDLGDLPKTLLYEYVNVQELATYLLTEASQSLMIFFNLVNASKVAASTVSDAVINSNVSSATAITSVAVQEKNQRVLDSNEQIAIIGLHGYYPQSNDLNEFWENLKQGKDLVGLVPANRWDREEFFHADPEKALEGKIYCKWGGFLDDFDKFDPHFFNITPTEAMVIDPQERLFIQSVWAAIEDAGYTRDSLKKNFPKAKSADVGVFAGVTTNSYHLLIPEEWRRGNMLSPSSLPWSIANRVSYFFDFQGPSMPVDTACSSSLVAIHLACESLKKQECQLAIAGGVNLYLHPAKYQAFCQKRMVSSGGKNCSFGAGDDGFVPGEGVGTLVLKPLSKARQDHDHIYAVIAASSFDHSGRSNGYSAPNPNSQANVIANTLAKAGISAESIGYIEGHGTGTQLGDSLEIAALSQAFQQHTNKKQFCPIGSVKANIGHSESAAGIAGIAKILLQFKHQQLAPSIHSTDVNSNIDFINSPCYLQHDLAPWNAISNQPRRALINSFGAGGVNACVVLEECKVADVIDQSSKTEPSLFILSAMNENRLRDYVNRMLNFLTKETLIDLAAMCHTLQIGREEMQDRLAIVATDVSDVVNQLNKWLIGQSSENLYHGRVELRRGKKKTASEIAVIKDIFENKNLSRIAAMWVAGEELDWETLQANKPLTKVSLPTYPFAKERYWVSDALISEKKMPSQKQTNQLHPLISYNSSTLKNICFSSLLTDREFYSVDHKVNGEKIFPGSGFLEIACIAGNIASEKRVDKIKDIIWIQPLSLDNGSQTVRTYLKQIGNSTEYEITSFDEDNETVVHSEGRLLFKSDESHSLSEKQSFSIKSLKERYQNGQNATQFYDLFESNGFSYGPSFQSIQEFYTDGSSALAKLKIAESLKFDFDEFILHPCLIDGALQAVVGLIGDLHSNTPYLPFALDEIEIIGTLTQTCYAYVEFSDEEEHNHSDIKKFNIKILSEAGSMLIKFTNFYVRALTNSQEHQNDNLGSYI